MPTVDLTHEQKRFRGDPTNPADVAAHQKRIAGLVTQAEAQLHAWQIRQMQAQQQDAEGSGQPLISKAKKALASAQKKVVKQQAEVAAAELSFKEAAKAAHK